MDLTTLSATLVDNRIDMLDIFVVVVEKVWHFYGYHNSQEYLSNQYLRIGV
jgi:hypothetical protein